MCTAISYQDHNAYFGRNLDLERGYGECVVITPRSFPFSVKGMPPLGKHYAMIGMAAVAEGFPLYFEATNEKGLSMAGLNFPKNAMYFDPVPGKDNVSPFAFIPWVLGQCSCMEEVKKLLNNINLVNIPFNEALPLSPLHWLVSDKTCSIVVESMADGLKIWDNPFAVLTNNPPFDYHKTNLCNFMGLHTGPASTQFGKQFPLDNYSLGLGALGLPGDYSSASRFVRAFFIKENSVAEETETARVNQFFHILDGVAMPKGCVWTENGFEYTRYSSCCNADTGVYYYKTYDDYKITRVDLHSVALDSDQLKMSSQ